eukprot:TRINITY_DN5094_c0_g1_i1.p1 TRINITY_DN5094_c0_g1~~TRINITY_DN5094_c0_g1_i1.p1  ORF type:complete len:538 (+),score=135.63 TRINITY_DN5094_c0_g1_i1:890-2503(+)
MATAIVEGATSEVLCDTDWGLNMELCDIINADPPLAKDVLRAVRKRLRHKSPSVQSLTLVLLETLVKNCGEKVRQQMIERGILQEMVKMAKKKSTGEIRDKIIALFDSWQDFFGGQGKFPQYHDACHELIHAGIMTPKNSSRPTLELQEAQQLQSHCSGTSSLGAQVAENQPEATFPIMSLSDIQKARGIMEVLMEMLNAIDPKDKESVKDEVIMDLVEQCSFNKQRAMQLITSTSDEGILFPALTLNDDLQRVLNKHDDIASGSYVPPADTTVLPPALNVNHEEEDSEDDTSQLLRRTRNRRPHEGKKEDVKEDKAIYESQENAASTVQSSMMNSFPDSKSNNHLRSSSHSCDFVSDDDHEVTNQASLHLRTKHFDELPSLSAFQQLGLHVDGKEDENQGISTAKLVPSENRSSYKSKNQQNGDYLFSAAQKHKSSLDKDVLIKNGTEAPNLETKHSLYAEDSGKPPIESGRIPPGNLEASSITNGSNDIPKPKVVFPAIPPPPAKYAERQKFFQQQQALVNQQSNNTVSESSHTP